jgi:sarcosine oxidase, subunit beta
MNEFVEEEIRLRWGQQKRSYDVVIIGGGGHGLATAYYLAARHGITNVAVLERGYIGSGNSGRNTTIIRANYGIPASVRFYQHSLNLYAGLEAETNRSIMHRQKGILWMHHTETGIRAERARSHMNQAFGADTHFLGPTEIKELVPEVDLTGGGRYPVLGGSYHVPGATARHDRVVWAYAEGAMARGVDVLQRTTVVGIRTGAGRVTGVETDQGFISTGTVFSATAGQTTTITDMVGLRMPIRTHPLQALVTNQYQPTFDPIVSSAELAFYLSQTARGQMLMGAEWDRQPSYSYRSGSEFLRSCTAKAITILPFLRDLRVLRQWTGVCDVSPDSSPIMGLTPVDGFLVSTGWGTWGFKAIPAAGENMAELIATGRTPELIAAFSLDRFARDRILADAGSAGTQ